MGQGVLVEKKRKEIRGPRQKESTSAVGQWRKLEWKKKGIV